jgi:hypothetical protein
MAQSKLGLNFVHSSQRVIDLLAVPVQIGGFERQALRLQTEFMVEMMCEGCATSVRNKLQTLPGKASAVTTLWNM